MTNASLKSSSSSPAWGTFTKFLVALVICVLIGALMARFRELITPLLCAFILAYQLDPVVRWLSQRTGLNRSMGVNLLYLVLAIVLLTCLIVAGIAIVQQVTTLYQNLVRLTEDLPARLQRWWHHPLQVGEWTFDLSQPVVIGGYQVIDLSAADWQLLSTQVLDLIKPALSRGGAFVGSLASSTVSVVGWIFFVLLVSYYCLHSWPDFQVWIEGSVPTGYVSDLRRLLQELGPIWNAFLRGQALLGLIMGTLVTVVMALLQVRYWLVLGLVAAVLEFVPIIGPFITGALAVLIALFQGGNVLGIPSFYFALVVLVVFMILQQVENSFLVPRIMGDTLDLHPAVILVGAIIGANLGGILGLLLAAPTIASLRLFGRYVRCKMFDLDPWPEVSPPVTPRRRVGWWARLRRWWSRRWRSGN